MKKAKPKPFHLTVDFYREVGGRWIADVPELPGVTTYGRTRMKALAAAQALALRVVADRLEHGEAVPGDVTVSFASNGVAKIEERQRGLGPMAAARSPLAAGEKRGSTR